MLQAGLRLELRARKALTELQAFYSDKYIPKKLMILSLPGLFCTHTFLRIALPLQASPKKKFRMLARALSLSLSLCNTGKSCGTDGVPYELLQCVLQTELQTKLIEMYNAILNGSQPFPQNWPINRVAFLAKVTVPSKPADLRPKVLSTVICKSIRRFSCYACVPNFQIQCFLRHAGNQSCCWS